MFRKILLTSLITASVSLTLPTHLLADTTTSTPTPTPTAEEGHRHPLDHIREALEKLHLTEAQKTQIHQILEDAKTQIKPILEADKGNREKLRTDLRPILKSTLEKIAAVLTPEQKHHLREILEKERADHA